MIYKKTPNIAKYIFVHDPDSFSLYIDIFAKNTVNQVDFTPRSMPSDIEE